MDIGNLRTQDDEIEQEEMRNEKSSDIEDIFKKYGHIFEKFNSDNTELVDISDKLNQDLEVDDVYDEYETPE